MPRSSRPPALRRRRFTVIAFVLTLLVIGGYTALAASSPPPALIATAAPDAPSDVTVSSTQAQLLVDADPLPTAIGWKEDDQIWSNDTEAHPLASISKLITVLVCLDREPLGADPAEWPTHTWSEADALQQQEYAAEGGVVFPVEVGTDIPLHDMLTLILLPSANDMVAAYANRVFGNNSDFVEAVQAWSQQHNMASLSLVEPSGMDERNVASPNDLVRIARIALDNEVITQFSGLPQADVPGFGVVENTNPLLNTEDNMVGLKTGRTLSAGFNLLAAQETHLEGRDLTKISVTMGRASLEERAQSGRDALAMLDALPTHLSIVDEGTVLGTAPTWQNTRVSFRATADAHAWLLPGETAQVHLSLTPPPTFIAGDRIGELRITLPTGEQNIPIVADKTVKSPDLWWNMAHPRHILNGFR